MGRVNKVSVHHFTLTRSFLKPFEVARERSGVRVGQNVVMLRNDVRGVSLERPLRNVPVCHSKQQSVLVEHGEGGELRGTI